MEGNIIQKSRNASRFAVNNIFTVSFCSKSNHVSRSRVAVNGITVMDMTYDERLQTKTKEFKCLVYTGLVLELETER
jgi:hypothetical protein